MILGTVSSKSCFYWLYRASPSLASKNIIKFWYWPSGNVHVWSGLLWVFEKGCLLWPAHSLGKTLLAFVLLHFVLQGQTGLLLRVSLDFLLLHSSPLWWKGHLFLVFVLEDLAGLHRDLQFQLLQHLWLGHRLGLLWSRLLGKISITSDTQMTPPLWQKVKN